MAVGGELAATTDAGAETGVGEAPHPATNTSAARVNTIRTRAGYATVQEPARLSGRRVRGLFVQVAALYRYPVKSMLGEEVSSSRVGASGLCGDRAYALLDLADGTVASGKHPRKWADLLTFRATFVDEPTAEQPLPPVEITFPGGTVRRSDDRDIDEHLSAALSRDVTLISDPPPDRSFEEVWPSIEGLAPQEFIDSVTIGREPNGDPVSRIPLGQLAPSSTFFDLSLLHILTSATLDRLTELAPEANFDVRRYRPNLLLAPAESEGQGFVENDWVGATLHIGELQATVTMLTMRCVMTTLPQADLERDRTTLRTIAAHNRQDIPGLGTWACAGVYADVAAGGTIHRGDSVQLIRG